jgi:hypothetical protein
MASPHGGLADAQDEVAGNVGVEKLLIALDFLRIDLGEHPQQASQLDALSAAEAHCVLLEFLFVPPKKNRIWAARYGLGLEGMLGAVIHHSLRNKGRRYPRQQISVAQRIDCFKRFEIVSHILGRLFIGGLRDIPGQEDRRNESRSPPYGQRPPIAAPKLADEAWGRHFVLGVSGASSGMV